MAVSTAGEVCNLALIKVGQRQLVDTLNDDTTPAKLCKALYSHTRDLVLSAAEWGFNTRRAVLALTAETRSGWDYVYTLPADCLEPLYVWAGERNPAPEDKIPFRVELNDAGDARVLLTDEEDAELVYAIPAAIEALWPPGFVEALACKLALELMAGLPVKPHFRTTLLQEYNLALSRAMAQERNAETPDVDPEGSLVRVRG